MVPPEQRPPLTLTDGGEVRARFIDASRLLASVSDIVHERSSGLEPPSWCERRGWATFFRDLPDDRLHLLERDGLAAHIVSWPGAPDSLAALAREILRVTALPRLEEVRPNDVATRRASPRKRAQVAAFARLLDSAPWRLVAKASRIVDVGSGHGHLTRHLAYALAVEAEGWERDPARVSVACSLTLDARARFLVADAGDRAAALTSSDWVVGLHACGELGDIAVNSAIAARSSLALVACCPQKRAGGRHPLSAVDALSTESLTLQHAALGLGNVRDGELGVEADLESRIASRIHRIALRKVLLALGHATQPGEEMRGINRRRASGSLLELVSHAFTTRGLPVPSRQLVEVSARSAMDEYRLARRWELPRGMLARLVEVWIALDRAAWLVENGYRVSVCEAFSRETSPRNVAVLATPERSSEATLG